MKQYLNEVHPTWIPFLSSLVYKEPLATYLAHGLYNLSHSPSKMDIFRVFKMPMREIKMVVLGISPNPYPRYANGLAYAGTTEKPSIDLLKLYGYMGEDLTGNITLSHLEEQGIFLLNTTLTTSDVTENLDKIVWKDFADKTLSYISRMKPCVWVIPNKEHEPYIKNIYNPIFIDSYGLSELKDVPMDPLVNYVVWDRKEESDPIEISQKIQFLMKEKYNTKINW